MGKKTIIMYVCIFYNSKWNFSLVNKHTARNVIVPAKRLAMLQEKVHYTSALRREIKPLAKQSDITFGYKIGTTHPVQTHYPLSWALHMLCYCKYCIPAASFQQSSLFRSLSSSTFRCTTSSLTLIEFCVCDAYYQISNA